MLVMIACFDMALALSRVQPLIFKSEQFINEGAMFYFIDEIDLGNDIVKHHYSKVKLECASAFNAEHRTVLLPNPRQLNFRL